MSKTAVDEPLSTAPVKNKLRQLPYAARELLAGGFAGGCAKTCVAPLERVKILFQTGKLSGAGVFSTLSHIYRTEGLHGLFKGNGVSVLRIVPYSAIHLSAYEYYRLGLVHALARQYPSTAVADSQHNVPPALDLLAGSGAGATAVLLTYPMDLVRTRLAYEVESSHPSRRLADSAASKSLKQSTAAAVASTQRSTVRTILASIWQQEGIAGLYRGISPTLMGVLPYAGLKFYVYQSMKQQYRRWRSKSLGGQDVPQRLPVPIMLTFGACSGLVAQTLTYPLDVVRRRMQVREVQALTSSRPGLAANQHTAVPTLPRSTLRAMYAIWQQSGSRSLYAGLSINYLKVVPSTAIGFTIYDTMKQYLDLPQNL